MLEGTSGEAEGYKFIAINIAIPRSVDPDIYPISLDYLSMKANDNFYSRPDLKTNIIINSIYKYLRDINQRIDIGLFMRGYSAGGMFCTFYSALHPKKVRCSSIGQSGGHIFLIEDVYNSKGSKWDKLELGWPVGYHDMKKLADLEFKKDGYKKVSQFIYIGEEDTKWENDNVHPEGMGWSHNADLAHFIIEEFGQEAPQRLKSMADFNIKKGCNIVFKSYPGIGHSLNEQMHTDSINFLIFHKILFKSQSLIFPHIAQDSQNKGTWDTEIAFINTGTSLIEATLYYVAPNGEEVFKKTKYLGPKGRTQINMKDVPNSHTIAYAVLEPKEDEMDMVGYTRFSTEGRWSVAVPAISELNTRDLYLGHIASDSQWWTGMALVNITQTAKTLTIEFNTGESKQVTLQPGEHRAIMLETLLGRKRSDIKSGVIRDAYGIVGLELFGGQNGTSIQNQLSGIMLTDETTNVVYFPHVASQVQNPPQPWWTGLVVYNCQDTSCSMNITCYDTAGEELSADPASCSIPVGPKEKYIGLFANLNLPSETAWFKVEAEDSEGKPGSITGFELFGTTNGKQLAGYTAVNISHKEGVFPKNLAGVNGWTGIAFVNVEDEEATITLKAHQDDGVNVASAIIKVGPKAKVVGITSSLFSKDISTASYIRFISDKDVVGFQLNGSSDDMQLDGLPAM